jgi:hypothetical protein
VVDLEVDRDREHGKVVQDVLICLDCLGLHAKLSSRLRACASDQRADRSAGLLTGQTHLSGTAETLVSGDPWPWGTIPLKAYHRYAV